MTLNHPAPGNWGREMNLQTQPAPGNWSEVRISNSEGRSYTSTTCRSPNIDTLRKSSRTCGKVESRRRRTQPFQSKLTTLKPRRRGRCRKKKPGQEERVAAKSKPMMSLVSKTANQSPITLDATKQKGESNAPLPSFSKMFAPIDQRKWKDILVVDEGSLSFRVSKTMTRILRHQGSHREDDGAMDWDTLLHMPCRNYENASKWTNSEWLDLLH